MSHMTILTLILPCSLGHLVNGGADFYAYAADDIDSSAGKGMYNTHYDMGSNNTRSYAIASTSHNGIASLQNDSIANLSEVRGMCPGAVEFYLNQTDPAIYPVKVTDCQTLPGIDDVRFQYHWVYGHCKDLSSFCRVLIQVPSHLIVRAHIEHVTQPLAPGEMAPTRPEHSWDLIVYDKNTCKYCGPKELGFHIRKETRYQYLATNNLLYVYYQNRPPVWIRFDAVKSRLDINYTSDHSGFVTAWYEGTKGIVCDQIEARVNHVIMVSRDSVHLHECSALLTLSYMAESGNKIIDKLFADRFNFIRIYRTTQLDVCLHMRGDQDLLKSCFKLLFSFHPEHSVPQRLSSRLFNCTVDDYWRFQQHLDCNMQVDCEDGRDETGHCPFSSPACGGWISAHRKCYQLFQFDSTATLSRIHICQALGFQPASIKTKEELGGALTLVRRRGLKPCFGLTCGLKAKRSLYGSVLMWSDNTAIYNTNHLEVKVHVCDGSVGYRFSVRQKMNTYYSLTHCQAIMCEKSSDQGGVIASKPIAFSVDPDSQFTVQQIKQTLVICPEGHVVHSFLSCDPKSRCGQARCHFFRGTSAISDVISAAQHSVDTVAVYSCSSVDTELSYSLLCDFRQDCADNSDESFCHHPACTQFTCTSGQCVAMDKRCDLQMDCLDDSDENDCPELKKPGLPDHKFDHDQKLSYVIDFSPKGYFTQQVINLTDPCPDTHYRCTKEWFYCLPVYTRCNGVFDCIFQEDERDCESWTCPGLYRCRSSAICVHADHMCDDWNQCPQHDDEWLCDIPCPAQCLCQGHAFWCPRPFSAHLFPQLRYLDARGSGMTPSDLRNNTYIVRLSLARCSISFLPDMNFHNLQFFDLSYNEIRSVLMNVFIALRNVQILILRGNPLTSLTTNPSIIRQDALRKIDLSENHLSVFDSEIFSDTPAMTYVNISYSTIHSIRTCFSQTVPHLQELDVRGTVVDDFPSALFLELNDLVHVYASDYRFCCDEVLPSIAPKPRCLAPEHYLSSCDDMIRSEVYRLNVWLVSVLASLGNVVCFVCHCIRTSVTIPYGEPVVVFMMSLQCADLCMGLYTTAITAAHRTFGGTYFHHENKWKESMTCKAAGFLFLLSSEVSLLMIFFLTLDHFMILCSPRSTRRFTKRSAALASGVTWFVGISLASIPLLPGPSRFGHYNQTAICSLVLQDERSFGRDYLFLHTVYILNLLICVMICVMQAVASRKTSRNRALTDPRTNPLSSSGHLLMQVAVTTVACWISINTASVFSSVGGAHLGVNVFMAIVVLPLSSAVNPVLCLWHAVAYKRRQKQEERLLHLLRTRRKCASAFSARS